MTSCVSSTETRRRERKFHPRSEHANHRDRGFRLACEYLRQHRIILSLVASGKVRERLQSVTYQGVQRIRRWPKGSKVYAAMFNAARAHGRPMMVIAKTTAAITQPTCVQTSEVTKK